MQRNILKNAGVFIKLMLIFFLVESCNNILGVEHPEKEALNDMLSLRYSEGTASLRSLQESLFQAIKLGLRKKPEVAKSGVWERIKKIHITFETLDEKAYAYKMQVENDNKSGLRKSVWMGLANQYIHLQEELSTLCDSFNMDSVFLLKKAWRRESIYIGSFSDEDFLGNIFSENGNNNSAAILLLQAYRQQLATLEIAFLKAVGTALQELPILDEGYQLLLNSKKSYVQPGETFEAEIFLGKYDNDLKYNVSIDGIQLPFRDGKAQFNVGSKTLGEQIYRAKAVFENPFTGMADTLEKDLVYRVGRNDVTVRPGKTNILYAGVDNPIWIDAVGFSLYDLELVVTGIEAAISDRNGSLYNITPTKNTPKDKQCTIQVRNIGNGEILNEYDFVVKSIPDPTPMLSSFREGGTVSATEMRKETRLYSVVKGTLFDVDCNIESYILVHIPKGKDLVEIPCVGDDFSEAAKKAVKAAKSGDVYLINEIEVHCPGDENNRMIGSMGVVVR